MSRVVRATDPSVEDPVRDILQIHGRPVATLPEAARLLGYSASTVRGLVHCGALVGSRGARNGPIMLTVRDLARWIVEARSRSLPDLGVEEREARSSRLVRARAALADRRG